MYRYFKNLDEYLEHCGIKKVTQQDLYSYDESQFQYEIPEEYIRIITDFHKKTTSNKEQLLFRIENFTGRSVEQFKVRVKRLKREVLKYELYGCKNDFEVLVMDWADETIDRAEQCINKIYANGYFELIERSMKRRELCIGNSFFTNIGGKSSLEIIDTRKCSYNMVEADFVYLLSKLKRRGIALQWKKEIEKFCNFENLQQNSINYIAASVSFPTEFIKCCERYRYGKRQWNPEQYKERLLKAIKQDGLPII